MWRAGLIQKLLAIAFLLLCLFGDNASLAETPRNVQSAHASASPAVAADAGTALDFVDLQQTISSLSPLGWNADEMVVTPAVFSAGDPQSLRMLEEFHCQMALVRNFQRGQRRVTVRVYQFDTPAGAYGAYTVLRRGSSTVVQRGDGSSEDDQSISFWQHNCYVNIFTTAEDDEEAKELVKSLADQINQGMTAHSKLPDLVASLPHLDRVSGSERLVMGPIAGRQLFPAPYMGILSIERSRGGAIADYQFKEPFRERLRLMVLDYGSPAVATDVYRQYVRNLEEAHKAEAQDNSSLFKMSNTYLLCHIRGGRLALITGARKRISPYILARQLSF